MKKAYWLGNWGSHKEYWLGNYQDGDPGNKGPVGLPPQVDGDPRFVDPVWPPEQSDQRVV